MYNKKTKKKNKQYRHDKTTGSNYSTINFGFLPQFTISRLRYLLSDFFLVSLYCHRCQKYCYIIGFATYSINSICEGAFSER